MSVLREKKYPYKRVVLMGVFNVAAGIGKRRGCALVALLILSGFFLFGAVEARAREWWNDDWQYNRKVDLNTTAQGADIQENLSDIPVLLRLHAGNFNFANAKPDGSDLRFVGPDGQTVLKYQIDTFDAIDEIGLIWVKVPKIIASSNRNAIYVYYGNEKAVDSQDGPATFSNGQALVYHLGEAEGPPRDSSPHKNNAADFAGGQALPSVIGKGVSFYGGSDRIVVPATPSLNLADGFTFAAWVRINQPQADGYLLSRSADDRAIIIGIDGTSVYGAMTSDGQTVRTPATAELTPETWHYLAVTAQPGKGLAVYVDGQEMASAAVSGLLPSLDTDIILGASAAGDHQFAGDLDEVQLSTRVRSPAWIKAMFSSQGLEAKLVGYGAEVSGGGSGFGPANYLKTIAANISIDGWFIIGLLMLLGLLSMVVLVSKAFFLYLNEKDNTAFQDSFTRHGGLFCLDGEYEEFENSPLHRVYRAGCETLTRIFGDKKDDKDHPLLNAKEMNVFKASLEKGYILETKGFNKWMVIMTLAISGGPFLGLLGTVWGVMNTFAAMAEAGEANIMAIAPGVASALATTVFGLIVAIPALFGYNYLAGKVKDLSADIGIFIDEFVLLVDGRHGEEQ